MLEEFLLNDSRVENYLTPGVRTIDLPISNQTQFAFSYQSLLLMLQPILC